MVPVDMLIRPAQSVLVPSIPIHVRVARTKKAALRERGLERDATGRRKTTGERGA